MRQAFLVEDNPVIRANLIPALEELADVVVLAFAETEQSAIDWLLLRAAEADVVVLDLFLAQGSGIGVLTQLRQRGINACVVVLTNHDTIDMRSRCAALGATAFYDKARQADEFFAFLREGDLATH